MRYAPPLLELDPVTASLCLLAVAAGLVLWRRQRADLLRALDDAQRQVLRLASSQQSLRDAERRRIARDLHDDLGQHLLALGMDAAALAPAPVAQRMAERIQQATRAMRAIVDDLQAEALEAGLHNAMQQQVAQFSRLSGIPCRLDADAAALAGAPSGHTAGVVYRVLQESLSNIVRHAQASEVSVGLSRHGYSLSLTVRDNGVGMPALATDGRPGHGLRGIAERMDEAGGSLDIASAPGAGTALTMSFPLPS